MRQIATGVLVLSFVTMAGVAGYAAERSAAEGELQLHPESSHTVTPSFQASYVLCKDVKGVKKSVKLFKKSADTYHKAAVAMCTDRVNQFGRHHMSSCGGDMSTVNKVQRYNIEVDQLAAQLKQSCVKRKPKNQQTEGDVEEHAPSATPRALSPQNGQFKPKCRDVKKWIKAGKHWDAGKKALCAASAAICQTAAGTRSCTKTENACEEKRPENADYEKSLLSNCR